MDLTSLKTILEAQEKAYRLAMDTVANELKSKITTLEPTVSDLTTSLEFSQSEIAELKKDGKTLLKFKLERSSEIEELKSRITEL